MTDEIINRLNTIENDVFEFAIEFKELMEMIKFKLSNEEKYSNDEFEKKLINLLSKLSKIKEEFFKSTEKIYKENSLKNLNKIKNDSYELRCFLMNIDEKIKRFSISLNDNNNNTDNIKFN